MYTSKSVHEDYKLEDFTNQGLIIMHTVYIHARYMVQYHFHIIRSTSHVHSYRCRFCTTRFLKIDTVFCHSSPKMSRAFMNKDSCTLSWIAISWQIDINTWKHKHQLQSMHTVVNIVSVTWSSRCIQLIQTCWLMSPYLLFDCIYHMVGKYAYAVYVHA